MKHVKNVNTLTTKTEAFVEQEKTTSTHYINRQRQKVTTTPKQSTRAENENTCIKEHEK